MKLTMHLWWKPVLLLAVVSLFGFACGGDDDDDDNNDAADDEADDDDTNADDDDDTGADDDDDTGVDDDDDDDDATPPPGCDTLQAGWNTGYTVDGVQRAFYLDLPQGVFDSWPWPVVFNWHGYGDTAANMRTLFSSYINNEYMPFILVTIEDTGMLLDWDIFNAMDPNNREIRLFDELLAELDTCYGIDPERVYTTGFSLGSAIACMMGLMRNETVAAVAGCSGGYASNPENVIPYSITNWPDMDGVYNQNRYVEVRLHGGVLDNMILPFGQYGHNDIGFLNEHGHDAIDCVHNSIHNMGFMFMNPENFIEFFYDHPRGTVDSPYATDGLPDSFPDICTFHPKQ
ncbi:MAG TPA: hypothetical protein PKW95_05595 [bacterium]|nr:hypothetical protein [bacterium]